MAQFILVYTHPTEGEERFELSPNRSYRIGSKADNDIVIDQKDVSRRHAVLQVHDGSFHITDVDSKNGTFVNGAKVASATFTCGDMVHLSSARLVILEVSTGSFTTGPEAIMAPPSDPGSGGEDTQKFRSEASMEDIVSLIETIAAAVAIDGLTEPLNWAVQYMAIEGAVVLYRDAHDSVGMLASAGDLGALARGTGVLTSLVVGHEPPAAGTRVQQKNVMGENLLVAAVGPRHVLVIRYGAQPPAIGDLRSLIAAVKIVLTSGMGRGGGDAPQTDRADAAAEPAVADGCFEPGALADGELAPARAAFEEWMIRRALDASDGRQAEAARRLGLSRTGLFKKIRKLGI